MCDSIESFLRNRGALVQVTQDHKDELDSDIVDVVNDNDLVCSAKIRGNNETNCSCSRSSPVQ